MKRLFLIAVMVAWSQGYADEFKIKVNRDVDLPVVMPSAVRGVGEKAIFGDNSMQDYYQVGPVLKKLADSTVAFVNKKSLVYDENTRTYKVAKEIKMGNANYADDKEDFVNQNILSFCSGAYVGNSLVLSAGHCIDTQNEESSKYFKNIYIVFGWRYETDTTPVLTFSEDEVYTIKEVKVRKLSENVSSLSDLLNNYDDYSLVALDRDPVNKTPLVVDRSPYFIKGKKVFTIGYPLGMAVKIDKPEDAEIFVDGKTTFQTNIDAFGGNSGGPVFDSKTNKIIGILVTGFGGEFDYELTQDIAFNIVIATYTGVVLETQTLYTTEKDYKSISSMILKKYKGEITPNGDKKYIAKIYKGTKINNRDPMIGIFVRLFGIKILNKGKLVRYDQNDWGTGVRKVPYEIMELIR